MNKPLPKLSKVPLWAPVIHGKRRLDLGLFDTRKAAEQAAARTARDSAAETVYVSLRAK